MYSTKLELRQKEDEYIAKNTQSRKWILTINNPIEKELGHHEIVTEIEKIRSCMYYCMSDEIGGKERTYHTHIFIACNSGVRFSTMKNRFPTAHIEMARGTCQQNRDYVFKQGKYEAEKGNTKVPNTQLENGEIPLERQGSRNDLNDLYDMLKNGLSDYEIFEEDASYILKVDMLEKVRQRIKQQDFKNTLCKVEVSYVWGIAGSGKTHMIMNEFGFENVYRVTNYSRGCFDSYSGQDVIVFEEFNSSFKIHEMVNFLDIYPLELPCRYMNKVACYTKVFIVSNTDLSYQYNDVQLELPETWSAFLRRIHRVIHFHDYNKFRCFYLNDYLQRKESLNYDKTK